MMSVEDIMSAPGFSYKFSCSMTSPTLIIISLWCTLDFFPHCTHDIPQCTAHTLCRVCLDNDSNFRELPEMLNTGISVSDIKFSEGLWQRFKKGVL